MGRKPVFLVTLSKSLFVSPVVLMMTFHYLLSGVLFQVILLFFEYELGNGAFSPYLSESFPARFRYSGAALVYNMGAPLVVGVVPVVAAVILGISGKNDFLAWSHIVLVLLVYDLAS
ncbi:hypothetical protein ACNF42_02220 [Cuniculiplasma sp. SKW3]|uniref:hypothetical protein n=1 Tax=Cuniculiplasma sp. SKW3 TaxID=3400170 RepID=UPI003FD5B8F2